MMSEYNEELLADMLPIFYTRLFPYQSFYKWLSYGNELYFCKRELSHTLLSDIYIRYQSFDSLEDLIFNLRDLKPLKIDIGAVYAQEPNSKHLFTALTPLEKELVFDIDMTDYDGVRTCCSGTDVCSKCWTFMKIACKILDTAFREDFGFEHILWVYSGRRGIHCWVCDAKVRRLTDNERGAIAEYLQIIRGNQTKMVHLYGERIHPSIKRALEIIKPYFTNLMLKNQDILGTEERIKAFIKIIHPDVRHSFQAAILEGTTSEERWTAFTEHYKKLSEKEALPKYCRNIIEEIMLQFCYPRLDINVSKGITHLLKAPFCVHPKTGKISVPFLAKVVDKFEPSQVPLINVLVEEIKAYDEENMKEDEDIVATECEVPTDIRDYEKTSLLKFVTLFDKFLQGMVKDSMEY